ncbi:Ca-activated chloride channel family protein [Lutibacter oceani]|uniref:Ca-activated chloride channel family protein n=1 Tax=Lutibacter oceani TaxID=1853311 RepID=A0A3D9S4N2_9FLAO|nr:VWA domain-containing protein [Lutibacter oceani]REE83522.1 Ca-activated chloride channel family protein [Lutibacter oceani]
MYQIEEPTYFLYLTIIPVVFVLFLFVFWWKKRKQKQFADTGLIDKLSPEKSTFKSFLKIIAICLGLAFLVISLTNPKMGTKLETVKREGVDIVFALDVSRSMLAEDIAPSRLEKAKQIITRVIEKLGSDRIGIIIYAGNSYPLLPITTDHAAAKMFLQNANPDMVSSQGTAINDAIERALSYFDNEEQTNRFLFIVSDGEDHEENTVSLAQDAAKQGIKIYTVGVGSEKGGPIPIKNNGSVISYKKDNKGEVVITKMVENVLRDIANQGNGKYINGNKTQETIDIIEDLLLKAEKSEFETKKFADYKDQFQWFIGLGLLFLIIDVLLLEKKTKWIQKLNLFNQTEKNEK